MALTFFMGLEFAALNDITEALDRYGTPSFSIKSGDRTILSIPLQVPSFTPEVGSAINLIGDHIVSAFTTAVPTSFSFSDALGQVLFTGSIPEDLSIGVDRIFIGDTFLLTEYSLYNSAPVASTPPFSFRVMDGHTQLTPTLGGSNKLLESLRGVHTQATPTAGGVNTITSVVRRLSIEEPDAHTQITPTVGGTNNITPVVIRESINDPDTHTQSVPLLGGVNTITTVVVTNDIATPDTHTQLTPVIGGTNTIG